MDIKPNYLLSAAAFIVVVLWGCSNDSPILETQDMMVTESTRITTSMSIGNLTVKGNAILTIDYTSAEANTLIVNGNLILEDAAQLIIQGNEDLMNDGFIIANEFSSQYFIKTSGTSILNLDHIVLRTQTGTAQEKGSVYMSYEALENSTMIVDSSLLDNESSWLLGNFKDHATLQAHQTRFVPTEIYLNDNCSVFIDGANTQTGLWLSLASGTNAITLPDIASGVWTWEIGSTHGANIDWNLSVQQANPGLGIQLFPAASASITGHGNLSELKIAYFASDHDEIIDNLHVGLQNREVGSGRLTLNNVNLGPIAWQIYSITSTSLTINNSTLNEIGIVGDGKVTVNNSILQLAVLACYGKNSVLTLNTCDVWNQSIETDNNAHIILNDCQVHGSAFVTKQISSLITLTGGSFENNPPIDRTKTMIDIITGYPNYNPFNVAGAPRKSGIGVVTCNGVDNCVW